jgi:hypothetical protein
MVKSYNRFNHGSIRWQKLLNRAFYLVVECRNKVGVKAILGKINKKGKN